MDDPILCVICRPCRQTIKHATGIEMEELTHTSLLRERCIVCGKRVPREDLFLAWVKDVPTTYLHPQWREF